MKARGGTDQKTIDQENNVEVDSKKRNSARNSIL